MKFHEQNFYIWFLHMREIWKYIVTCTMYFLLVWRNSWRKISSNQQFPKTHWDQYNIGAIWIPNACSCVIFLVFCFPHTHTPLIHKYTLDTEFPSCSCISSKSLSIHTVPGHKWVTVIVLFFHYTSHWKLPFKKKLIAALLVDHFKAQICYEIIVFWG